MSEDNSKTLVGVVSCAQFSHKLASLYDTWIPDVIEQGFHVDVFDGRKLEVSDDYLALPYKTKALCNWALDHGYEYLLKIDDDAYVRAAFLKTPSANYAGIKNEPNDYGWNGHPAIAESPKGTHPHPYASGGAYWLSAVSMKTIASAPVADWAEDRWVGDTLAKAGISLVELPGYKNVVGDIHSYLTREVIALLQIPDPHDMYICNKSNFDYVIQPLPRLIHTRTVRMVPSAPRLPRNFR